jgi:hypothetical protein
MPSQLVAKWWNRFRGWTARTDTRMEPLDDGRLLSPVASS